MSQTTQFLERDYSYRTVLFLAVFALLQMNAAAAQNGTSAAPEPSQLQSDRYDALADALNRQLAAMRSDYEMREAIVIAEIDRRRQTLFASTDDEAVRGDGERDLSQLQQQAISTLQSELAENRGFLEEVRSFATAELDGHGALSDATWGMIAGFSDAHDLTMPDGFPVPEVSIEDYEGFPAALMDCTAYEETYLHPWTGTPLTRVIHGVTDAGCQVEEELPGDGLLTCHYPLERLPFVADYYANSEKYESLSISSHTEIIDGIAVTTNTYTLDGELYDHPIDAALAAGECVVSGY